MKVIHCRFGPKYSEQEREVYGRANNTGHGGCWINEDFGPCGPDCILADISANPITIELPGTMLPTGQKGSDDEV